ncbi:HNH endonuclease [Bacillus badius]|uniref:HNH endonuclease n=1 Tax=Bacillus badius TaxID=1455 RepID=A0ABR5ANM2_BACBA|nr:HNH endonuclease [Bacillus badius]KIL72274.1 hypothetical protein SD77_3514 [Bacillus badius]KZN99242.1 hypothetical protein A4244_19460 [Bacillus badius]KZR57852.1 hypothetical protein A3781_19480 [Bacillus badius]MED0668483.1 HNH endonuclease [Bacillus badius]MED4717542.1 HNH endonuclease [Bacillus badius]
MNRFYKNMCLFLSVILFLSATLPFAAERNRASANTLEAFETEADSFWSYEDDTSAASNSSNIRTGYLSGYTYQSGNLVTYDEVIFDDPNLSLYMKSTPGELQYDDTDNLANYPQMAYEDMNTPTDDIAYSSSIAPAWLIPVLVPVVSRVGQKIFVKQFLKKTTKKIIVRNGHLAGKRHPVTNVKFSSNGFPIFSQLYQLSLPKTLWKASNRKQFKYANERLLNAIQNKSGIRSKFNENQIKDIKAGKTPRGYVWHHHEKRGILQLVNREIHNKTGHTGGKAIWGSL